MGCLIYYVLTDGQHPFGNIDHQRICNIEVYSSDSYTYALTELTYAGAIGETAKPLIQQMINHDPNQRYIKLSYPNAYK